MPGLFSAGRGTALPAVVPFDKKQGLEHKKGNLRPSTVFWRLALNSLKNRRNRPCQQGADSYSRAPKNRGWILRLTAGNSTKSGLPAHRVQLRITGSCEGNPRRPASCLGECSKITRDILKQQESCRPSTNSSGKGASRPSRNLSRRRSPTALSDAESACRYIPGHPRSRTPRCGRWRKCV